MLADLSMKSGNERADLIRPRGGESSNIVCQACHVVPVAFSKIGHGRNPPGAIFKRDIPFRGHGGFNSVKNLYLSSIRNSHLFPHMAYHFINQKDYRSSEFFREVKCLKGHIKTFA